MYSYDWPFDLSARSDHEYNYILEGNEHDGGIPTTITGIIVNKC